MSDDAIFHGAFMSFFGGLFMASLTENLAPAVFGTLLSLVFITLGTRTIFMRRWSRPSAPARWMRERKS